jgi:hypothetical protein
MWLPLNPSYLDDLPLRVSRPLGWSSELIASRLVGFIRQLYTCLLGAMRQDFSFLEHQNQIAA